MSFPLSLVTGYKGCTTKPRLERKVALNTIGKLRTQFKRNKKLKSVGNFFQAKFYCNVAKCKANHTNFLWPMEVEPIIHKNNSNISYFYKVGQGQAWQITAICPPPLPQNKSCFILFSNYIFNANYIGVLILGPWTFSTIQLHPE